MQTKAKGTKEIRPVTAEVFLA